MIIYMNPVFYVFLATLTAFILLLLTTLSVPVVSTFYFLYSSQADGVRFGIWGWCLDDGTCSSPLQLGFTWQPQIDTPITAAFVLYPMSVLSSFSTMVCLLPVLRMQRQLGDKVFSFSSWISVAISTLAFMFMIGICSVAKYGFEQRGYKASYGNMHGLSLAATLLLVAVAVSPYILHGLKKEETSSRHRNNRSDLESRPSRRRGISRRPLQEKEGPQ